MLGSGLDIGVVVAGSALLLISLIIFFYALWTYRASKANVTPPERASTHLEDVPLNIAPVANVAQINISVDSEGSTVHEGEHARQVLQESGLYDLAAPSPRNELAPSPADTYRAVPAEPSFRVPGPPPFEPPQLQPAQSPARDESHDPDHEVQARDEVRLSQPSRSPDEAVATTQHPALDTLDPELGVRSRSRPVSNAEVSYVGWSDSDDEVDPKEEGRQLYPSPPNTDSTQGSMDDVRAPPLTSAPIDRAEVHVDPHDEPPVAAAGAPTEPTPSPETPWVDGAEAETEGYGGVGAEPGSRDTLDKGERMATLDRIAQNSARREAVAEERRRKLAEDYAAAEAERAKLAAEELERILEEERMRKEAEEAKKYAGIEEAQQRLAELPFTFSFTMDESPKKADPTTGVSSTMSRKSKKSPPKATSRFSFKRRSSKNSYSPRAAQQTQDEIIHVIEGDLSGTDSSAAEDTPPTARKAARAASSLQSGTAAAPKVASRPPAKPSKAPPPVAPKPTPDRRNAQAVKSPPPPVAPKPRPPSTKDVAKTVAVSALEPAIRRHPSLAQQGESDYYRMVGGKGVVAGGDAERMQRKPSGTRRVSAAGGSPSLGRAASARRSDVARRSVSPKPSRLPVRSKSHRVNAERDRAALTPTSSLVEAST